MSEITDKILITSMLIGIAFIVAVYPETSNVYSEWIPFLVLLAILSVVLITDALDLRNMPEEDEIEHTCKKGNRINQIYYIIPLALMFSVFYLMVVHPEAYVTFFVTNLRLKAFFVPYFTLVMLLVIHTSLEVKLIKREQVRCEKNG